MLYSTDAQVQYEAQELLHLLAREPEMGGAICTGIVEMLEKDSTEDDEERDGDEAGADFRGKSWVQKTRTQLFCHPN